MKLNQILNLIIGCFVVLFNPEFWNKDSIRDVVEISLDLEFPINEDL